MSALAVLGELPGAVVSDGVVQHYGAPAREQRDLETGAAVVALGDRGLIEVGGADRLTWLDSITSQALASLRPGQSTELLVLDPQGRIEHAAGVLDDGVSTWLFTDAADTDPLATWLRRMVFRAHVTVEVRLDLALVGYVAGGAAAERVHAFAPHGLALTWADPWGEVSPGGHQYAETSDHPGRGWAWVESVVDPRAERTVIPGPAAGALAAEALRVAAWRPRWSREVDERSIPHESDWIRTAVHLSKGCYRGQETVAKVHNLGHPPRRLAALHLDGSLDVVPDPGNPVFSGESEVGAVTSVARHAESGPIALAILSRRAPLGDLVVRMGDVDVAAAQEVIVPADAGATAEVPRLTRLSRRALADTSVVPPPTTAP